MQSVDFKYAPSKVQLLVGNEPGEFSQHSREYEVHQSSLEEQVFDLTPDLLCGRYIRLRMIGKPGFQNLNFGETGYFVALNYVGVEGVALDEIQLPPQFKEEEEKKQSEGSSLINKEAFFSRRFTNLMLNSNNTDLSKVETMLNDEKQILQLVNDNYSSDLINKLNENKVGIEKIELMFQQREQVLLQLDYLVKEKIISFKELIDLFKHALKVHGIAS